MKIRHKAITASERAERDTMLQRAINIQNRHWKDGAKPDTRSEEYKQFKKDCDRRGVDAESIWNEAYNVRKDLRTAEASTVKCGTGMKITKRRVMANKKSVKAATSGKIPYDLVSMLVVLRDWANTDGSYVNKEHEDLVGIADFLYNNGSGMVEYLQPEAKAVYDKYGKKYFDMVLDDAAAIDSQISSSNVKDLIADYNDRAEAFEGGVNAACGKKSVKGAKVNKRRAIKAGTGSYESNLEKIQYYMKKILADAESAAKIIGRNQFVPIEVPELYDADESFYEWYVTDYVNNFDDMHPNGSIYDVGSRNTTKYNVSYGSLDGETLENSTNPTGRGSTNERENFLALCDIITSNSAMDDLYYVTEEYGFTLEDLANDPYRVFEHFDDSDKLYYSEEVLDELDLWTQSDRDYDFADSAKGLIDLYNEVDEYFSYDHAESLLKEFYSDEDESLD